MNIEVRDEPVLIAAVANQFHAAMPFDEAGEPGLHVAATAAFAIGCADLRCEHLVERRALEDGAVSGTQESQVLRHVTKRCVQATVGHRDARVESNGCSVVPSSVPT